MSLVPYLVPRHFVTLSLSISHITKSYGSQLALDDVSFEVRKGEITGFIGPNGAGKSTTMKIITGYISPDKGEVFVNGLNVAENPIEIRRITGYLPENNPLYPEMYVKEYLGYVAAHYMGKKEARESVSRIISRTGLDPECHKKISALSKGYRQRVGLAQALLHDPEILILDEPTSGLDPGQIIEIRNLISELGKEKTIILSTHIMQEVEAICDRVIIISGGKIAANDETAAITGRTQHLTNTIQVEFREYLPVDELKKLKGVIQVIYVGEGIEGTEGTKGTKEGTKGTKGTEEGTKGTKGTKGTEGTRGTEGTEGTSLYLVETAYDTDLRGDIFDFAVKNGLTVLSMQKKDKRLEEVFIGITGSGEGITGSRDHGIK